MAQTCKIQDVLDVAVLIALVVSAAARMENVAWESAHIFVSCGNTGDVSPTRPATSS